MLHPADKHYSEPSEVHKEFRIDRSDINWTDEGFEVPSECWQSLFQHEQQE